jgi:hypothetical protein
MGSFDLTPGFHLDLQAGSTAAIYSADVVVDITAGP